MKDKMDHPQDHELAENPSDGSHQKLEGVDASRRRLFGAGIAVPVILTMSSRTAWGGGLCGPSAFNSMTFSSHAPQSSIDECSAAAGKSPLFWKQNPSLWDTYLPDGATPGSVAPFSNMMTMSQVLEGSTTSIEAHGIAALLNASSGENLFGKPNSAAAIQLVEHVFPAFIGGMSVELPGTT
ncbi:hypothetical protein, partial [Neptunomonas sp.]|uniref:hypothetical protein n=1 Tax=Neptunomonas sp. TaxID=1971898 RepID=UPI0025F62423